MKIKARVLVLALSLGACTPGELTTGDPDSDGGIDDLTRKPIKLDGGRKDFAERGDLAVATDLAAPADLAPPADLAALADLATSGGPRPLGQACVAAGDCASGFCVEGVCCDSACSDASACEHCARVRGAGADGRCTRAAELPRATIDTSAIPTGLVPRPLLDSEDLQSVLDASAPGVEIIVPAHRRFSSITLPPRSASTTKWTVIRTASAGFPGPGQRVGRSDAALMPRITGRPGIRNAPGAHHYWIIGFDIAPPDQNAAWSLVSLGDAYDSQVSVHHIVLDRVYLHGFPAWTSEVSGVIAFGAHIALVNSRVAEIHTLFHDDQCTGGCREAYGFVSWNGPGPYKIANNYIAAGSHNIFFGGENSQSIAMQPQDIEISSNHLYKPLSWHVGDAVEPRWQTKTIIELKTGWRVFVDGNYFENEWNSTSTANARQIGNAMVISPRNGDSVAASPWSSVRDVTFTNNKVVSACRAFGIAAEDDRAPSGQTSCVDIRQNLFDRLPGSMPDDGRFMTIANGPNRGVNQLHVEHNTVLNGGAVVAVWSFNGSPYANPGFVFRDNLSLSNGGIWGDGYAEGASTLRAWFPNADYRRNDMVGGAATRYSRCTDYADPNCSFFTGALSGVQFTNPGAGDYHLAPASPDARQCSHKFDGAAHDIGVYDWSAATGVGKADLARRAADMDP